MTSQELLDHVDSGQLWPTPLDSDFKNTAAYDLALGMRKLRVARGEMPKGYKIGFTNRYIWLRYQVCAPIWGTVRSTTLSFCDGEGEIHLSPSCQPRIEADVVFGMKATPVPNASLKELYNAIEWVAPGFEVVQSHLLDWKFRAPDAIADGALHARLLVGRKLKVSNISTDATELDSLLAEMQVTLMKDGDIIDRGIGANVLDSPLCALHPFLKELRQCQGAQNLRPGDVVTTGLLTDAWPVLPGECWTAKFGTPLSSLTVNFK